MRLNRSSGRRVKRGRRDARACKKTGEVRGELPPHHPHHHHRHLLRPRYVEARTNKRKPSVRLNCCSSRIIASAVFEPFSRRSQDAVYHLYPGLSLPDWSKAARTICTEFFHIFHLFTPLRSTPKATTEYPQRPPYTVRAMAYLATLPIEGNVVGITAKI